MTRKKTKSTYRLRNWSEYNRSLINRGSLTIWVSDDVIKAWLDHTRTGKRGSPRTYTDTAQGLMLSITTMLGSELDVPDYTTLGRRRKPWQ